MMMELKESTRGICEERAQWYMYMARKTSAYNALMKALSYDPKEGGDVIDIALTGKEIVPYSASNLGRIDFVVDESGIYVGFVKGGKYNRVDTRQSDGYLWLANMYSTWVYNLLATVPEMAERIIMSGESTMEYSRFENAGVDVIISSEMLLRELEELVEGLQKLPESDKYDRKN